MNSAVCSCCVMLASAQASTRIRMAGSIVLMPLSRASMDWLRLSSLWDRVSVMAATTPVIDDQRSALNESASPIMVSNFSQKVRCALLHKPGFHPV